MLPVVKEAAADDSESDVRTLACRFEPDGERFRDFSTSITMMAEEEFSYLEMPTNVPRVTPWFLRDLKRSGTTPSLHHNTWALESSISTRDRSFHDHALLCDAIEAAVCVDQLDVMNLWMVELLVRRLMLIADAHSEGASPDWDGAEHWNDTGRRKGGVRIAPQMLKHVAPTQSEKNAISQEKRKAHEGRKLKGTKDKGGGKGDSGDGG